MIPTQFSARMIGFASLLALLGAGAASAQDSLAVSGANLVFAPIQVQVSSTASSGTRATSAAQGSTVMGTLGTTASTGAVAAMVMVSAAEAVASTGQTR